MASKNLELTTKEFQLLAVEMNVFLSDPKVDMYVRHCFKKINNAIKNIVSDYEETFKELVLKYAEEGKDYISPVIEDENGEKTTEENPKYKLFIEEIKKIEEKKETVSIQPLDGSLLREYNLTSYEEKFKKEIASTFGLVQFVFLYELFD